MLLQYPTPLLWNWKGTGSLFGNSNHVQFHCHEACLPNSNHRAIYIDGRPLCHTTISKFCRPKDSSLNLHSVTVCKTFVRPQGRMCEKDSSPPHINLPGWTEHLAPISHCKVINTKIHKRALQPLSNVYLKCHQFSFRVFLLWPWHPSVMSSPTHSAGQVHQEFYCNCRKKYF